MEIEEEDDEEDKKDDDEKDDSEEDDDDRETSKFSVYCVLCLLVYFSVYCF